SETKNVEGAGKSGPHPGPTPIWILLRDLGASLNNRPMGTAYSRAWYPTSSRSRTRYLPTCLVVWSLKAQTVTGTFVVPDCFASRRAFRMSGPCQVPSLAPLV